MATKKWQVLEGVVAALERSLAAVPGTSVIPNAMVLVKGAKNRRQVDVLVEIPTGPRSIRIAIEVRDNRGRLDVTQIEQLAAKFASLEVDRGCIVSTHGVTNQAKLDATRYGVEIRALAQIDAPDWWLPTAMRIERRVVHLLALQLNYADDALESVRQALGERSVDELLLLEPPAAPHSLKDFVAGQGVVTANKNEFRDQEEFTVTLDLKLPADSRIIFSGGSLPLPGTIVARFRMHHGIEFMPLTAFALDADTNAFSGVSAVDGKQLTIVAQSQSDGTRKLAVTLADSKPKRTKVP